MGQAYIVAALRTAGGKRGGRLSGWHPVDLAARVLDALVERTGIDPAAVEDVIMGCVGQAGEDVVTVDVPTTAPSSTSAGPGAGTVRLGLATCYDLRSPELFRALLDDGAEVFVVPAAWPAARVAHWTLLGRARAVEDQAFVVQCNTAGTHARTEMGGRSQVVAPNGDVLAEAGTGEDVLVVDVDLGVVASTREAFPVLGDRRL